MNSFHWTSIKGCVGSPPPWKRIKNARASSSLPFAISHLGDSGKNQTRQMTMQAGTHWKIRGRRHDKSDLILCVARVIAAAGIAPPCQLHKEGVVVYQPLRTLITCIHSPAIINSCQSPTPLRRRYLDYVRWCCTCEDAHSESKDETTSDKLSFLCCRGYNRGT